MKKLSIAPEKLPESIIDSGPVMKLPVIIPEGRRVTEIAILQLEPGSKIKKHKHLKDSEIYFTIENGEYSLCERFEEHGLTNNTDKIMNVLSVKMV